MGPNSMGGLGGSGGAATVGKKESPLITRIGQVKSCIQGQSEVIDSLRERLSPLISEQPPRPEAPRPEAPRPEEEKEDTPSEAIAHQHLRTCQELIGINTAALRDLLDRLEI